MLNTTMLLTCIMTCAKYAHIWPVIRKNLGAAPHLFFLGGAETTHLEGDVLYLAANDKYDGLCEKVLRLLHWLREAPAFAAVTHVLKIDDYDIVVTEAQIAAIKYADLDYAGQKLISWKGAPDYHFSNITDPSAYWYNRPYTGPWAPYAAGGRGYILSRTAIDAICTAVPAESVADQCRIDIYEDLMVGKLLKANGISPRQRELGVKAGNPAQTDQVHFVAFGTLPEYQPSLRRIKSQAENSGYFASTKLYIPQTTPGLADHAEFIAKHRRGYGYWIWKPLVILDRMSQVPEGDIVAYADTGCTIHSTTSRARGAFAAYLAALRAHPAQRFAFQTTHVTETWCKADVLAMFGIQPGSPAAQAGQIMATIQMYANTPANRAFLQEWLALMTRGGYHAVTDAPSVLPNAPSFREHRHDQSIFSLLAQRDGIATADHPGCTGTDEPFVVSRQRYS